jgi:hypothetical protein
VYAFCHDELRIKKQKRSIVMLAAERRFGRRAPKEPSHVTLYANRHEANLRKRPGK